MPATGPSTISRGDTDSIFNFGQIVDRLSNTALSAFNDVAPRWLEQQLDINGSIPIARDPTFQNTDSQRQPAAGLTSNSGNASNTQFVVNQSTILLVGVGLLGVLFFLRDRG